MTRGSQPSKDIREFQTEGTACAKALRYRMNLEVLRGKKVHGVIL